jgi:chromosome segregation ATPase
VCDSLDNLSKTYQSENSSTEAKAVALDHSTAALKNANNYLVEQLTAVEQRNQDMLREMQELRQELADMRASVQGYSPE